MLSWVDGDAPPCLAMLGLLCGGGDDDDDDADEQ